jgi:hypothetical protein
MNGMEKKFALGDRIRHKDPKIRKSCKLSGEVTGFGFSVDGNEIYYIEGNGMWALLVKNQDNYEKY